MERETWNMERFNPMNIILIIISGLLTAFVFPAVFGSVYFPNLGFLAWVSLVPLFVTIRNTGPRKSFLYTFLASVIFYGISLYWLYTALNTYGHLEGYVSVAVLALLIVVLASYISLAPMFAAFVEKKTGVNRFWTLPLFWVVCEIARNYGPCNGFPWGNITNSQYAYLPIIQIVDIIGVYGLTYIMIAVNVCVADVSRSGVLASMHLPASSLGGSDVEGAETPTRQHVMTKILFACTLLIFTIVYGYFRIHYIDKQQSVWPSIRVALIQGNIPQEDKWRPGLESEQLEPYKKFTKTLENSNVNLIVWPEASYPWTVSTSKENLPPEMLGLNNFKNNKGPYLLMGGLTLRAGEGGHLEQAEGRYLYNSMLLLDNSGDILGRYHKVHLVPFGEYVPYKKILFFAKKLTAPVGNFAEGRILEPLFTDNYQIAGLVCYEDLFPEIARALVKNGANFIAVITNDAWYGRSSAAFQHLAISVFRAVENRRFMVKAANSGVTAVVDPVGRVISKTGIFEDGMIVSGVKLGTGNSLYTKFGDWFAYACCLIAAFLIGWGLVKSKFQSSNVKGNPKFK